MCTTYQFNNGAHEFTREFYNVSDKSKLIIDTIKKGVAILSIIEITDDELNKVEMYANGIRVELGGGNK
jgi:hypothetical protein